MFVLLFVSCTEIDHTNQYKISILKDLYFMESYYGIDAVDDFINNEEILGILKELYPKATDSLILECYELRKKSSNRYNR